MPGGVFPLFQARYALVDFSGYKNHGRLVPNGENLWDDIAIYYTEWTFEWDQFNQTLTSESEIKTLPVRWARKEILFIQF